MTRTRRHVAMAALAAVLLASGAACGDDRQIVSRAFGPHPLGDLPPSFERNVIGARGHAAVRIGLAVHAPMKMVGRSGDKS